MQLRIGRIVIPGVAAVGGLAAMAPAATVDLSTSNSGTINGAIFQRFNQMPGGTGVIQSFLRVQANGTEQGYNTSGRPAPFDDKQDPIFTHDLRISDLVTRTVGGTSYYEFLLDTNEPNGGSANLLSLDQLKIFTGGTGSLTTTDVNSLGTLRFDLDTGGNNTVIVNDTLSHGSGQSDARILIPTTDFAGASQSDFVYLFARLGDTDAAEGSAEGGFEEFGIQSPRVVPLPSAAGLGLLGLLGTVVRRTRR